MALPIDTLQNVQVESRQTDLKHVHIVSHLARNYGKKDEQIFKTVQLKTEKLNHNPEFHL